ncbi:GNAT family N-acetyltransferase [Nocardioides sp. BP30]|uniref:GNAT family N-acetyltransferase n=1 Tax=Nocardioides sp. BP30 TaxID=3036374 RepID=UPI0024690BA4|nr:GNAT family N-acetyltransferase [Nocardioides sp. BP30]WGL53871.1 GNAT family N-acetyltransferase [Nocardioides sp. BP30]
MTVLRPGEPADARELAAIQVAARAIAPMPPNIHPEHEIAAFLTARLAVDELWVAEVEGDVVGYARFTATWLDDLYVLPGWQATGLGGALLDLVKSLRPEGLGLYVFAVNEPARRFYERRGFAVVEGAGGTDNEEREPDLRMEWSGAEGLG